MLVFDASDSKRKEETNLGCIEAVSHAVRFVN